MEVGMFEKCCDTIEILALINPINAAISLVAPHFWSYSVAKGFRLVTPVPVSWVGLDTIKTS